MASPFAKSPVAGKGSNMGNIAKLRADGGGDAELTDEVSTLDIATNIGPYASDEMDQFERAMDLNSTCDASDLSDNEPVKQTSITGTKSHGAGGLVRAVSNPETSVDQNSARRVLSKDSRNVKLGQPPRQVEQREENHDKATINNLVMSITQYTSSDKLLDKYWDFEALRLRIAGRKSGAAENEKILANDLRHYSKAAYFLHGCKIDMEVLTDWIPMTIWTGGLTAEKVQEITKEVETEITSILFTKVSRVVEQWMCIQGFPKLPTTVTDLFAAVDASKSWARRAKFKMLIEENDLEAYRWIEDTLNVFNDILPLHAILSDKSPLNLVRDHLIAMTVAWAGIHYDKVLLKAVQNRLQEEHDAECASLQLQSARARPDFGLVRDSEMLEKLSDRA